MHGVLRWPIQNTMSFSLGLYYLSSSLSSMQGSLQVSLKLLVIMVKMLGNNSIINKAIITVIQVLKSKTELETLS